MFTNCTDPLGTVAHVADAEVRSAQFVISDGDVATFVAEAKPYTALAFAHRQYFASTSPTAYFDPSALMSVPADELEQPVDASLLQLSQLGLLTEAEVVGARESLDELSQIFETAETVGEARARLSAYKDGIVNGSTSMPIALRSFAYTMAAVTDTLILADALAELAQLEANGTPPSVRVLESRLLSCLFGRKIECWGKALVRAGIAIVAAAAGAVLTVSTAGAGTAIAVATAQAILVAGAKAGTATFITAVLGSYVEPNCSCRSSGMNDICVSAGLLGVFVIDPTSLNCQTNQDQLTLNIVGITNPGTRNLWVKWAFTNAESPDHPGQQTVEGNYLTMRVRQLDPNFRVRISAYITFTPPGATPTDGNQCIYTINTPNPSDFPFWAWDIYQINSNPGPVIISGPSYIDATEKWPYFPTNPKRYTGNGVFRTIPSTTGFSLQANWAGTTAAVPNDPFSRDITWNSAGDPNNPPTVYATSSNLCGNSNPSYLTVNIYAP